MLSCFLIGEFTRENATRKRMRGADKFFPVTVPRFVSIGTIRQILNSFVRSRTLPV
jgi:hypothetical protein